MKSKSARGACALPILASLASTAWCQDDGLPSLFPVPPLAAPGGSVVSRTATTDALWGQLEPSPAPQVTDIQIPMPPVMGSDYSDAMKGGYDGSDRKSV